MQGSLQARQTSNCSHAAKFVATDNGIGALFRDHGEKYISAYKPDITRIKLIRSIRVCKTPALGGKRYTCLGCNKESYVYYGCGNSRCPKCQGIKRLQWQDKLANKIFKCPYQHIVFTMPHRLNGLAKRNPTQLYNILMRSAWSSLSTCAQDENNLGALPGAIMVLHTFGSDLKYHVHVHTLVTFGGLTQGGAWRWPKRKRKIVPFRQIRSAFRKHFIDKLSTHYEDLNTRESLNELIENLMAKSWCVHAEPPTANTKIIQEYLGRYICRIGLSKNRFHYDEVNQQVTLSFKDYLKKNADDTKVPTGIKNLEPMVAIDQIMAHCLPPYFQKCRYYGLHATATYPKISVDLPTSIKNNNLTIRTVFQIITAMLGIEVLACPDCKGTAFHESPIAADSSWKYNWLPIHHNRGSPQIPPHITHLAQTTLRGPSLPFPKPQGSSQKTH